MSTTTTLTLRDKLGAYSPDQAAQYLKILVYGEPGAGKTVFCGSAGNSGLTGPVLIADVEGGSLSLRNMPGVDVVQIRSVKDLEDCINALYKDTTGYYKTFAIDSITELQKLDMVEIMIKEKVRKDSTDLDVPSMREWGRTGNHMRLTLRAAKDLPMHVIITALEAHETDEATSLTKFYPSIPGKLRGEIPGFFDIVGRLEAKVSGSGQNQVIKRFLQTSKSNRVIAKDRTWCLPGSMEDPSIPAMWDLIGVNSTTPNNNGGTE